jgi:hypothetical protein
MIHRIERKLVLKIHRQGQCHPNHLSPSPEDWRE